MDTRIIWSLDFYFDHISLRLDSNRIIMTAMQQVPKLIDGLLPERRCLILG